MRYYGNKDKVLGTIEAAASKADLYNGAKFVDLFSGTSTVGKHFKKLGYTVIANDNLEFCYALAVTFIETNQVPKFMRLGRHLGIKAKISANEQVLERLNNLLPEVDFISRNYAPGLTKGLRTYLSDENAGKVDAVRNTIQSWKESELLNHEEYYYLITSLLEAINLVSNVAGTYAASLKTWDPRALKPIVLSAPEIIPSTRRNKAFKKNANDLVRELRADILYLDPPYNSRQYNANYFLLELIAKGWYGRVPEPKGVTGIVTEEETSSEYSKKQSALAALKDLVDHAKTRYFIMSYSNEGIIPNPQLVNVLSTRCTVELVSKKEHKRYKSINQTAQDPTTVDEYVYFVRADDVKPRYNSLGGAEWLRNSFSVWRDVRKNTEEQRLQHPAMFPIALAGRVIESYTRNNQTVLDPFLGSGSTAIAAIQLNRKVIGIDLNEQYIEMTRKRLEKDYSEFKKDGAIQLISGDSRSCLKKIPEKSVDICVTSPPYWDILNQSRTADNKAIRNYSDEAKDLGNLHDYHDFLTALDDVFVGVHRAMKNGGILAVNVMDIRKKSVFYPLHSSVIAHLSDLNFRLRDIIIWDRNAEYNNMKPLGYPYSFIINKVHEYILIFEKP